MTFYQQVGGESLTQGIVVFFWMKSNLYIIIVIVSVYIHNFDVDILDKLNSIPIALYYL